MYALAIYGQNFVEIKGEKFDFTTGVYSGCIKENTSDEYVCYEEFGYLFAGKMGFYKIRCLGSYSTKLGLNSESKFLLLLFLIVF